MGISLGDLNMERSTEIVSLEATKVDAAVAIGANVAGAAVGLATGVVAEKLLNAAIPEQDKPLGKAARFVAIHGLSAGVSALAAMSVTSGINDVYGTGKATVTTIRNAAKAVKENEEVSANG